MFLFTGHCIPLVKDDREGPVVEGIPAKEKDLQGSNLWCGLWPLGKSLSCSLQDLPAGVQQQLQPAQRWNLRRLPTRLGLQWADLSQEHEDIALRPIQRKEKDPFNSSNRGERERERDVWERGRTVTARSKKPGDQRLLYRDAWRRRRRRDQGLWRCFTLMKHARNFSFFFFYMLVMMKMMSIQVLAQYWKKRMILDICWWTFPESQENSVSNIPLRKLKTGGTALKEWALKRPV